MKMLAILMTILGFSLQASVIENESYLSEHFSDVLKSYDTRGVVRVDIDVAERKVELPGTNFLVNTNIISKVDKRNIKSLVVNVFSELPEMPADFQTYVRTKTRKFTNNPQIKFIQLEKIVDKKDNGLKDALSSGIEKLSSKMGKTDNNSLFALLSIPVAIVLIALFFRSQLKKSTESMSSQLASLVSALQEQGIGTSMEGLAVEGTTGSAGGQSSTILEQSMWEAMNESFFSGVISDCYWCHEDQYASFVWSKAPVSIKRMLLEKNQVDGDYVKFFSSLTPVDKGFASHSYYLNPWPYQNISNVDLGKMVRDDKRLFNFISPMRIDKIELTLEEKLECIQQSDSNSMKEELFLSKLENMQESDRRYFESTQEFKFASLEEEERLLAMDVDYSVMKKFPSLGWIFKLEDEKIEEILSSFQAKDLAASMYLPESFKEKLFSKMSERRRELVESYAQKTNAKKTQTYHKIVQLVMKELEPQKSEVELKEVKSA